MSGVFPGRRWVYGTLPLLIVIGARVLLAQAPTIEECDRRVRDAPSDPASYYCFVIAASGTGQFDEAAAHLEEIRRQHPERQRTTLCLASIRHAQQREETESLYREAIVDNVRAADTWGEVYARSGLGRWLSDRGRLEDADRELEQARVVAETISDGSMLANVLTRQAGIAFSRLNYARSYALFKQAESLVFPSGPAYLQSWVLSGLGSVYWALGDERKAGQCYERQAEVATRSGDRFSIASARWNIALVNGNLHARHEVSDAVLLATLQEALQASIDGENKEVEARCHLALGQLLAGHGALEEVEKALALPMGAETAALAHRQLARAIFNLGPERREEGMQKLEAVIEEAQESENTFDLARGKVMRASLVRGFWPEREAIEASFEALDAVEEVRAYQDDSLTKALVFSQWTIAYDSFVDWLLTFRAQMDDPEHASGLALEVMERMRARVLLEHLSVEGSPERDPEVLRLANLQQALAPDQMLLSYQLWERGSEARVDQDRSAGSWLIALTRRDVRAIALPAARRLEQRIRLFEGLLERRDDAERPVASMLYKDLLGEALSGPGTAARRLVIIPDGRLHSLPFAALRPSAEGPMLVETRFLSFAPSVALWMRWRQRSDPLAVGKGVLSIADPEFLSTADSPLRAAYPWVTERSYGGLPHARREADSLLSRMGSGEIRSGADATEAWLKSVDLTDFSILHFAAHSLVDAERPENSAVLLSPGDRPGEEDGLLHMREIAEMELSNPLVILSSCRSATGSIVDGEGVMGLARAFFRAGARTVVGSLWPLRDDEAADLVAEFSEGLAAGQSVTEALARAQRASIGNGLPADAWAGMVVLGDGDLRLEISRPIHPALWWILAVSVVFSLAFLVRSRFFRWNRRQPPITGL